MAKKTYTLTPLTGVHIGSGEELSFLDYKIVSRLTEFNFQKPTYVKFSSDRILQRIIESGDQKKLAAFERASVNGNMKELQKFFHEHCISIKDTDYPCDITKGFLKTYNENLSKDSYQNAAIVFQMYHPEGSARPIIPGSSLKGSIRTALLNKYLHDLSDDDYNYGLEELENEGKKEKFDVRLQKKLLDYSDAKNDPLRTVAIPDSVFKASGTQLVGSFKIVSFDKHTENLDSIDAQIQAEVIRGELLGGKAATELSINIDEKLQKTEIHSEKKFFKIEKAISFEDIRESCNYFYWREFQKEYDYFYKDVSDGTEMLINELKVRLDRARNTEGQFIIRVGRWSQVEFVTFEENFRRPKTRKDKFGKALGYGETRTLFDYDGKYLPMGWCVLTEKEKV
jgi:CRISPR-associated protein Csm5